MSVSPPMSVIPIKLPPMMAQYVEYKRSYPDCLLLFQVGDFYEVFFDDAVTVARTLNLTLTTRDKNAPNPIPMCGVPIGVIDSYLDRLVDAGHSVAVVSQTGASSDGKGMFQRSLERIVTPGVRLLGAAAQRGQVNLVSAIAVESEHESALCWTDIQSGVLHVKEGIAAEALIDEIGRIGVAEILLPAQLPSSIPPTIVQRLRRHELWARDAVVRRADDSPAHAFSSRSLTSIRGYASLGNAGRQAVRSLLRHIDTITVGALVTIQSIEQASAEDEVSIDRQTRDNLELVRNLRDGSRAHTLLDVIDRTVSISGGRLLAQWLQAPSSRRETIESRQEMVAAFEGSNELRARVRETLSMVGELDRIAARIELGIVSPRELGVLRDTLGALHHISELLQTSSHPAFSGFQAEFRETQDARCALFAALEKALVDSPPLSSREGGIFRQGFDEKLDSLRALSEDGASWMTGLEARERDRTGIPSLKIRFNNVIGYFIEITKTHREKVPAEYTLRQDTVNALRFVTEEIKSREHEVVGARDGALRREEELLAELRTSLKQHTLLLRCLSVCSATIDTLSSLAELAVQEGWVRPRITDDTRLEIDEGRHPVVAALLRGQFVANSLSLGEEAHRCVILTGPNMGGKSTFLRQTALIVVLAQIGSWVPARAAVVGRVDKIFARIGASDDMAEGESTFMVEMKEASHIISQATRSSLVLIDEIGRGTSTSDGLAIAEAILEWIVERSRCRTLFATHFHELTDYPASHPQAVNMSVGSHHENGEVIFTHEIRPGAANRSYGLEVAKRAGLPEALLKRAKSLLAARQNAIEGRGPGQLALFSPVVNPIEESDEVRGLRTFTEACAAVDPHRLTPVEALVHLDRLVAEARAVSATKDSAGDGSHQNGKAR